MLWLQKPSLPDRSITWTLHMAAKGGQKLNLLLEGLLLDLCKSWVHQQHHLGNVFVDEKQLRSGCTRRVFWECGLLDVYTLLKEPNTTHRWKLFVTLHDGLQVLKNSGYGVTASVACPVSVGLYVCLQCQVMESSASTKLWFPQCKRR